MTDNSFHYKNVVLIKNIGMEKLDFSVNKKNIDLRAFMVNLTSTNNNPVLNKERRK